MELLELLDALRTNYLLEYEAAYRQQTEIYEMVVPEAGLEISGGVYKRIFVADFVGINGDHKTIVEVGIGDAVYGGNASLQYGDLSITFGSVSWDAMRFSLQPAPQELAGFESWFDKWLDLEGLRKVEGNLLSEVIHNSRLEEGIVEMDFGSAPIDAVVELFGIFELNGVTKVQVRSSRS